MPNSFFAFRRRTRRQQATALLVMAVLVVSLAALLHHRDPSAAIGALCGGGLVMVLSLVAMLRTRSGEGTTVERAMSGGGDERDKAVVLNTFAVTGWFALVAMTADVVALVLGAPAIITATIMLLSTLAALVISGAVLARRM